MSTEPASLRRTLQPLPRPPRSRRRDKLDRGLPADNEIQRLAIEYLNCQRKAWPNLVKAGLLPEPTPDIVKMMMEDFKHRHRTGSVDLSAIQPFKDCGLLLGANYNRFSCDNSSPNSILDQMVKSLLKAKTEARFVPWIFIFADYSVSGTNPSRRGYISFKSVLQIPDAKIDTTYIDDFTRASRDEIEWWRLANLSKRLKKRLIGASDGFDLSSESADAQIAIYALISKLFIRGTRQKVRRGMGGAARRGGCLGKLSLGFSKAQRLDEKGELVFDQNGHPENVPCLDPATRGFRSELYELFALKNWTPYKICKYFNAHQVDGWDGWTEGGIKKLLRNPSCLGVFIWNKTRREYNHETLKWEILPNPRSEWVIYFDKDLALTSIELWRLTKKKLSEMRRTSPLTGRKRSRNEVSATTLFSGTLFCGYCGREITLMRSGKYKVMACGNGPTKKHGCQLTASKSVRIIRKSLLDYLKYDLFNGKLEALVRLANARIEEEAKRPTIDTKPIIKEIRTREQAVKKLFSRIENCEDPDLLNAYEARIAEHKREINALGKQIREAEAKNRKPPRPLSLDSMKELLVDFDELLELEPAAAAKHLRMITGKITITQVKRDETKRGGKWIASFAPDLLAFLRARSKSRNYPDSVTLEFLSSGNWIVPEPVSLSVDLIPKHARIAADAQKMARAGLATETIRLALGTAWETAAKAISLGSRGSPLASSVPEVISLKPVAEDSTEAEVVRLRNQKVSFVKIGLQLGISNTTASAMYYRANHTQVLMAAREGQKPDGGSYRNLSPEVVARIEEGLRGGERVVEIAKAAPCGISTVYRERARLGLDEHRAA